MELNSYGEAAFRSATQKFANILWNLQVPLPCSQKPTTRPYPHQINTVNITPSYLSKIHFNIILSPTSRCS
jgi:hypothetical protein